MVDSDVMCCFSAVQLMPFVIKLHPEICELNEKLVECRKSGKGSRAAANYL